MIKYKHSKGQAVSDCDSLLSGENIWLGLKCRNVTQRNNTFFERDKDAEFYSEDLAWLDIHLLSEGATRKLKISYTNE